MTSPRVWVMALWASALGAGTSSPLFALLAGTGQQDIVLALGQGLLAVVYATVGALILARQPRNAIGWILLAIGLLQGLSGASFAYGLLSAAGGTGLPLAAEAMWVGNWVWAPSLALLATFLLLLFPDGRLPSPRWRPVAVVAALATASGTGALALGAWPSRHALLVQEDVPLPALSESVFATATLVMGLAALLSIGSLFARYRGADGVARQQLKWFALGGTVTFAGVAMSFAMDGSAAVVWLVWMSVMLACMVAVPVSVGVAVLRYRLYEIDRIVSRTVSYALVTGILIAVYAGGVLLIGRVFAGLGGDLAVAASTLGVAALFGPLRRRVQGAVDRRFNRARYDAEQTVAAFVQGLRGAVDPSEVQWRLDAAVTRTVEPATVSVWLSPQREGVR